MKLSEQMRGWETMEFYNVRKVVDAWADEVEALEARLSKMEARLEYAEDVLGNVGMDDTLDYLEESWPLARERVDE